MQRKIIHIDMDAFYASVEQRDFPEYRGKPVVVGGQPGKRGVVAAASYEARRFGIRSAMPSTQAQQRCPHLIFARPRFEVYKSVSRQIRAIFFEYTDLVEPLSLDEAYLDVTENKKKNPSATLVAQEIRARILAETHLTSSAGVAPNKFVAKVASDVNKPNGICVVRPEQMIAFIGELPIGRFYGIGKATEKKMHAQGIYTGKDLQAWDEIELVRHFGKTGAWYYRIAQGLDDREVSPHRIAKSVGVEETFDRDLITLEEMEKELVALAEELEHRLKRADTAGKTVTLKLRYANFETITRSKTGKTYVRDASDLLHLAKAHLLQVGALGKKVRLLGITVSNLDNGDNRLREIQLELPFGEEKDKPA